MCRKFAVFLRRFPSIRTDVVGLLDEWAARFFEELDYVREGNNGILRSKYKSEPLTPNRGPQLCNTVITLIGLQPVFAGLELFLLAHA